MEQCNREKIVKQCTCTYQGCSRKGKCCECVKFHRSMNEFPGCFFTAEGEKLYDRSWEALEKHHI